jgi:tetratricopeptide (TPR) repeat protein
MKWCFVQLVLFGAMGAHLAESSAFRNLKTGDPYPRFCAQQYKGTRVCSERFQDQILIISFLRTGQKESQELLRELSKVHRKYKDRDVTVVGILSGDVDLKQLDALINESQTDFPVLLDPLKEIYGAFGVFVYPATGVFDRDRRLRFYLPSKRINFQRFLEAYVDFLLGDITAEELEKAVHPTLEQENLNLKKARTFYNFAKVFFKQGKLTKAMKMLDRSLEAYDNFAPAYALYGMIYVRQGKCRLAIEKFDTALRLDPQLEEAENARRSCLEKSDNR